MGVLLVVAAVCIAVGALVWPSLIILGGALLPLAALGFVVPSWRDAPKHRYDLVTDDVVRRIEPNPPSPHRAPYSNRHKPE